MIDLCRSPRVINFSKANACPGPGSYTTTQASSRSHAFGGSQRSVSSLTAQCFEDLPGPGTYTMRGRSPQHGPRCFNSTSPRFRPLLQSDEPGPGSYSVMRKPTARERRARSTGGVLVQPEAGPPSIPQIGRHEVYEYDGDISTIGPAKYRPQVRTVKTRPTAARFGKAKRVLWRQSSYKTGPGSYNLAQSPANRTGTAIGTARRFTEKKGQSPGPGLYVEPERKLSGRTIPKGKRDLNFGPQGEGQETTAKKQRPPEVPSPHRPGFCSSSARKVFEASKSGVGPGTYNPARTRRVQTANFTFSKRSSVNARNENPGPGHYRPVKYKQRAPVLDLDEERFNATHSARLGPGSYSTTARWGDRSFNLYQMFGVNSGRSPTRSTPKSPGPGQYQPRTQRKPAGGQVSKEPRFVAQSPQDRGPGFYEHGKPLVKKSFNIRWRR